MPGAARRTRTMKRIFPSETMQRIFPSETSRCCDWFCCYWHQTPCFTSPAACYGAKPSPDLENLISRPNIVRLEPHCLTTATILYSVHLATSLPPLLLPQPAAFTAWLFPPPIFALPTAASPTTATSNADRYYTTTVMTMTVQ